MTRLPPKLPIQIIGPTTIKRARAAYRVTWSRDWPYSDSYLAELVIEAKEHHDLPASSKARPAEVRETTLELMRETHHFTPEAQQ